MSLLDRIEQPADLRELTYPELADLCEELRLYILDTVSRTGGHLSPNLGIVELTLALHRVFDSPRDRIIWDVGHQTYVHKLITGRRDRFESIRSFGGLSGYPCRKESPHDQVENSHASVALSYALGNALTDPDYWTVAVIGDGALTGGMAYEALNHIAYARPRRLVIVVNDNGRSYGPTVGGLAMLASLSHLRTDPRYEWVKKQTSRLLRGLPLVGETADELAVRFKEAVKAILEPSTVFDTLGLKYTGRIPGHNLEHLEETFGRAKEYDEPVVVHVVTEKGSGYQPAIDDDSEKLHGVGAFDLATGQPHTAELRLTDVVAASMVDLAGRYPEMMAISAAMVSPIGLSPMAKAYPDRVLDTGIAEQHAVGLAAGLAMAGKKPVCAMYSTFLQRAYDQVLLDVGLHNLPVTLLLDRAGVTGPDGASHHGVFDLSFLRTVPNLVLGAPSDGEELSRMLETAMRHNGPIAIRYSRVLAPGIPELPAEPLVIGEWEERSTGDDVLFLANGRMIDHVEKAAATLAQKGISCGVVNARWVKPLDSRLAGWVADYPVVVTVEDNSVTGGFGSAVLEALAGTDLCSRVSVFGIPDEFLPHGSAAEVFGSIGLDPESIAERVETLVDGARKPRRRILRR